jgi:hypothetical protein
MNKRTISFINSSPSISISQFDSENRIKNTVNYKHNKWYKKNSFPNAIILKLSRILVCAQ